jgi:glutaredoxin 3
MGYRIYSKEGCSFCDDAIELLQAQKQPYVEMVLNHDITRDELLAKFPEAKTLPIILCDGEMIGGFTDLERHLLNKGLDMTTTAIDTDITRRSLVALLKKNTCLLIFTKANNERREMKCTLNLDLIPAKDSDIQGELGGEDKNIVKVYDLEKKGWRSVRLASLRRGCKTLS